jgi:hypothetical protein
MNCPSQKKNGSILYQYPAKPDQPILIGLCNLVDTINNAQFSSGNKSVEAQPCV